jgi:hypothetical protein
MLLMLPFTLAGALAYYFKIPELMIGNLPVAVGTMDFQSWYDLLVKFIIGALTTVLLIAGTVYFKPNSKFQPLCISYL